MALALCFGRLGALGTFVVPMDFSRAAFVPISAIEIIAVEKLVLLVFLHLLELPIFALERFVHVPRPADDGAELDVVLLCDPTPAMTVGLQGRNLIEGLAG